MEKIIDYIKQYKIILLLFGASIILSTIYLITTSQQGTEEPPTEEPPTETASFNSIAPGVSTEKTVREQFGEPLSVTEKGLKKTLEYESSSLTRRHQVTVEETQVLFIKEIVSINDDKRSPDLVQKYGIPTSVLYNKTSPNDTFPLYVYPEKGLAYLGHEDGTLIEIWYFPPTSIDEFINKWAQNYSLEKPSPESIQSY